LIAAPRRRPWRRTRAINPWACGSWLVVAGTLAPFAALAVAASPGSADLWSHLLAHVVPAATLDTLTLLAGVGLAAMTIGVGLAWLVTAYDFPGRRVLAGALLLPLAMPTYIVAYAYLDVLHPVGPVQEAVRAVLGFDSPREFRLPDIRSMTGCTVLLAFVLYPYVYLSTRATFLMQSANLLDAARTLGCSRAQAFFRVGLPLARPAIVVGLSLTLMETLNDIGASEFLGVRTLTVAIYTTWVTRSDLPGAAQIAIAMLAVVLALGAMERWGRRRQRYANDAQHPTPLVAHRLRGVQALAALTLGAVPIAVGFAVPAAYLVHAASVRVGSAGLPTSILEEALTTVLLAFGATAVAVVAGTLVAYASRTASARAATALVSLGSVGYATPGTVVAIGLLPVVIGLDTVADIVTRSLLGVATGLLMLGTGLALVYAYVVRFLAITIGGAEAGFSKVSRALDEAAATLGAGAATRLWRIHLPLLRPAVATAAVLMFVDCMKELPATLLLRPIGVETLATHLYGEAARGTYEDGAVAALLIVFVGLGPVWLLAHLGKQRA